MPAEFDHFCQSLEKQTPRQVQRHLDYGRRLRNSQGLEELYQWLGRILHDQGQVYSVEDRALAYEIAVGEALADEWGALAEAQRRAIVAAGPVNKVALFVHLLSGTHSLEQRATLLDELAKRYRRTWRAFRQVAQARPGDGLFAESPTRSLLNDFSVTLAGYFDGDQNLGHLDDQAWQQRMEALEQDLEFAEDRAERAHARLRQAETQVKELGRQLRESRENGQKLRQERTRRIKGERQTVQVERDLEQLQQEYRKLERRLQEMTSGAGSNLGESGDLPLDIARLRQLGPHALLGVSELNRDSISQARRRLAAVLHPDRVAQLPQWIGLLFEQILGLVNEICDRYEKKLK